MEEKAPRNIKERIDELKNPYTDTAEKREELILENAENLVKKNRIDSLTQLRNREAFESDLDRAVRAMHRVEEHRSGVGPLNELAVMFIDLDHFKNANDKGGHATGDQALVEVADCITSSIREGQDVAGRYAGDEFCVFFPRTKREGVHAVAEKIIKKIRDNTLLKKYEVTASVGLFCANRENSEDLDAGALIKKADGAMYRAKEEGRNTIVIDGAE